MIIISMIIIISMAQESLRSIGIPESLLIGHFISRLAT